MQKALLLVYILVLVSVLTHAQALVEGDYRSKQSGNWNNFNTWQIYDSGAWRDAVDGEIPGGTSEDNANNVYLEEGHTITLAENAACKDLNFNAVEDVTRLNLGSNTLSVWGKMRTYQNEAPGIQYTPAGTNTPDNPILLITNNEFNGGISFKGNVSRTILHGIEISGSKRLAGWRMIISFLVDKQAYVEGSYRVGEIIVESGTLRVAPNGAHRPILDMTGLPDGTAPVDGKIKVLENGTFLPGRGVEGAGDQIDSLIVEKGGSLLIEQATTAPNEPIISADHIVINGIYGLISTNEQVLPENTLGGNTVTETHTLLFRGGKKILLNDILVKEKLELVDNVTFKSNSFNIVYSKEAAIEYSGTSTRNFSTDSIEFKQIKQPHSLIFSNTGNISLKKNDSINANLYFRNSKLLLDNNIELILGNNCDTSSSENGYILINETNTITKKIDALSSFPIHIGDTEENYLPVILKVNSAELLDNSTMFSVNFIKNEHPTVADKSVNNLAYMLETKTNIPNINYDIRVTYPQSSVIGIEDSIFPYAFKQNLNIAGKVNGAPSHFENILYLYNLTDDYFITGGDLCFIENNNIETISIPKACDSSNVFTILTDGTPTSVSGNISYIWMYKKNNDNWKSTGVKTADYINEKPFYGGGNYKIQRYAIDSVYCPASKPSNSEILSFSVVEITNNIGTDQNITDKELAQTLTSTLPLSGGDGNYDIQWFSSLSNPVSDYDSVPNGITEEYTPGILLDTMYFTRVVKSDICQDTSNTIAINVREDNTSGIFSHNKNTSLIKIYPNPASETIYINSQEDIKLIEIITTEGKVCKQTTDTKNGVNISDLEKGIYILKASTINNGISSQKFVIH